MVSRRQFLADSSAAALAASWRFPVLGGSRRSPDDFIALARAPDVVTARTAAGDQTLTAAPDGRWSGANGLVVQLAPVDGATRVALSAPAAGVSRIGLRWRAPLGTDRRWLGDAWERGYGDFEWRGVAPDRVMPWYAVTIGGDRTDCYGVRTGPAAFCFWQADGSGLTLWADVRSGGVPVSLGERTLAVCELVCREGHDGESAFAALHAFCRQMCPRPRLPAAPVYGHNDWYWAYGNNSAATVRADAEHIVSLSPTGANRPFVVVDDGWQPGRGASRDGAGTWDRGNEKFGDMAALAADVKRIGGRPGIWIRPLEAPANAPDAWRLSREHASLDPTVADVRHKVAADIARLRDWGMELIKHDYSTWDIFGRWGSTMGASLTRDGWGFAGGASRTTAEVIDELYRTIREAAGDIPIIGCNTVSHLSAGRFEMCRIGDDTSGREWERVPRMGVNALAFRGAQHGAFYVADADCAGVTRDIPWSRNRQWLDLLSRSGTMLMVSLAPDALGADETRDLREALARAARPQPLGEPLDWERTTWPATWRLMGETRGYDWGPADGASR